MCQEEYIGTALTIQTSLGFLLTVITIRLIPSIVSGLGWQWAFPLLAIGPVIGIWAMYKLRQFPAASKMAGGKTNKFPKCSADIIPKVISRC